MWKFSFFALVLVISLSACAPTYLITIHTERPPKMKIPAEIKNIAVLEFAGPPGGAEIVARKLEEQLIRNEHYRVISRSDIGAVMNERAFAETGVVEESARNQLKLKKVDAIVTGTVATFEAKTERGTDVERHPRRVYRGQVTRYDSKGRPYKEPVYDTVYDNVPVPWIERHANVVATFTMIDVATGQKVDTLSESGWFSTGKVKGGAMPVPEAECIDRAVLNCVVRFIEDISVHTTIEQFPLAYGPGVSSANKMAASGLYSDAQAIYSNVLASNPKNWAATYNLGLVLEAQGRYDEAETSYRNAMHASGGRPECMTALKRAEKKKTDSVRVKTLKEQTSE